MAGRSDSHLGAAERWEARRALQILEGSGLTISEAARIALEARGRRPAHATTIDAAIDGFLRRALERRLRETTFDFYEIKLRQFAGAFVGETLDAVTRPRIRAWLDGLPVSASTRKGTLRAVHALYAWALSCEPPLCSGNAAVGLRVEQPLDDSEPPRLLAADVQAILRAAGRYRAAVALMVFAGIRPEEMAGTRKERLDWRHVDAHARVVRIPAEIAKTRTPRVLEHLPDVLWHWITPAPELGPISPGRPRQWIQRCLPALLKARPEFEGWPHDILRHTAASYLLALWSDAGRVSMVLGHEGRPTLLFARYRATMTHAEAQAIAALRP